MNLQALQATSDSSANFFPPQEQRIDGLHQLFENTVDATPDRTALVCEGVDYTYLELDWLANRIKAKKAI